MSEMFASSGKSRDEACVTCGAIIEHRELIGIAGSVVWNEVEHVAPCGLPCLGGGVHPSVYRTGAIHKTDGCPRCKP